MILPKIKIGRKSDRNFFDMSHDVNTTSDFGFCQPTLIQDIIADSKVSLTSSSFVRLAPLPCPTFGRVNVNQYTAFVPHRDVFLAYDAFMARKTVTSGVRSYIPEDNDYIDNTSLFSFLLSMTAYNSAVNSDGVNIKSIGDSCPFRLALYSSVPVDPDAMSSDGYMLDHLQDPLYDALSFDGNDFSSDTIALQNALKLYGTVFMPNSSNSNSLLSSVLNNLGIPYYDMYHNTNKYSRINVSPRLRFTWKVLSNSKFRGININASSGSFDEGVLDQLTNWRDDDYFACSERITLDNADFVLRLSSDDGTVSLQGNDDSYTYSLDGTCVCLKLTPFGRRLWKIFTACRINFGYSSKPVEMMQLLSYYKVWFDKYNPGRNYQWFDCPAYYLIHSFYDFGKTSDYIINLPTDSLVLDGRTYSIVSKFRSTFADFLQDLGNCFYTLPIDNVTVATEQPLQNLESDELNDHPIYYGYGDNEPQVGQAQSIYSESSYDSLYGRVYDPNSSQTDTVNAGGLGIKLLNRIYNFVNKNSVLGQRIDEYLKAHNLGSPLPDSLILGDNDFPVFVEDQFSSAETEQGYLGEFAGKAKAYDKGKTMHFEAVNAGYLIQLFTIVPFGGYVQTSKVGRVNRMDFYNPLFDSLGKEPLSHYEINGRSSVLNSLQPDSIFGFVPQYYRYKVANNLANGGFSLPSQRGVFLPYSLDRIFTENHIEEYSKLNMQSQIREELTRIVNGAELVPDEILRYIGRNPDFGNYNRIFYDVTGLTDNFIVQIVHDFKYFAPMKPVSESFDTFDPELDNGHTNIEHA